MYINIKNIYLLSVEARGGIFIFDSESENVRGSDVTAKKAGGFGS